jgi:hypothetical protein
MQARSAQTQAIKVKTRSSKVCADVGDHGEDVRKRGVCRRGRSQGVCRRG